MTQERLAQLEQVAGSVIELMRIASQPEDLALTSIERLARAARCEWAAYWMLDRELQRVRRIAIWSAVGQKVQRLGHSRHRTTDPLSESTAAHVWRTGKPLWTTGLVLVMGLPRPLECEESDLHSGVWFAVKTDTAVYGVIELLGRAFSPRTAGTSRRSSASGLALDTYSRSGGATCRPHFDERAGVNG